MTDGAERSATFAVADREGLHARPCARIAGVVQKSRCAVVAVCEGRTADASSVLQLLQLCASHGALVEFRATGRDAAACLEALGRAVAQS